MKKVLVSMRKTTSYFVRKMVVMQKLNRIPGKSVRARAFALERQQSPVSYVGINIVSRTILKTMYRTISKSTVDDETR